MGEGVVGIERHGAGEQGAVRGVGLGAVGGQPLPATQDAVAGGEIVGRLALDALQAADVDADRERGGDGGDDLVLHGEDVVERAGRRH